MQQLGKAAPAAPAKGKVLLDSTARHLVRLIGDFVHFSQGSPMPRVIRSIAIPRCLLANTERFDGKAEGDLQGGGLLVLGDQVIGFTQTLLKGAREINGVGRIVLPRLVKPHLHLDKAFTLRRTAAAGSDLMAAIHAQEAFKAPWNDTDLRARASRAMARLRACHMPEAMWIGAARITPMPRPARGMGRLKWRRNGRSVSR